MSGSFPMQQRMEAFGWARHPAAAGGPQRLSPRPACGVRRIDEGGGWCASPAVARLSDGGFVVVWQSYLAADEISYRVAGRRLTAAGEPAGAEFSVDSYPSLGQTVPRVAACAGGGFLVVWESRPSGPERDVLARAFDAAGQPLGATFLVDADSAEPQGDPDVTATDEGYVVAWSAGGAERGGREIRGRRFDAAGSPLASAFTALPSDRRASWPALARGADGGFVVAYAGPAEGAATGTVRAQRFDRDGARRGGELRVDGGRASCGTSAPAIAAARAGGFAVAWLDYSERGDALRVCAFFADGTRAIGEATVAHGCSAFALDGAPDGRLAIGWSTLGAAVETAHFLPDGRPAGADAAVVADGPAGGHTPQLALDDGGGTLFVWQGLDDPSGHAAICARAFRSTPPPPTRASSPGEIAAP